MDFASGIISAYSVCPGSGCALCLSFPMHRGVGADVGMLDQDPGGQELLLLLWCGGI